jgi:predicted MFS family arabinose efflux permease
MILFLCISDFVIASMPTKLAAHKSSNPEQKHSETVSPHPFRFVMLIQGVIKAIGTVFGGRPSGRKVTETVAIASMTSRFDLGAQVNDRQRISTPHQT